MPQAAGWLTCMIAARQYLASFFEQAEFHDELTYLALRGGGLGFAFADLFGVLHFIGQPPTRYFSTQIISKMLEMSCLRKMER